MEAVSPTQGRVLAYSCPKQGQDFKPSAAPLYPNMGQVATLPPPPGHLDAKSGLWQIPLDEESSLLTTFNTPFGRYRFNVVPFGFVFAQEVFHITVSELFADIPRCERNIDNILVWGTLPEEHGRNLKLTLDRVKEINLTLNQR